MIPQFEISTEPKGSFPIVSGSNIKGLASARPIGCGSSSPGSSLIAGLREESGKESIADESILISLMTAFGHGIGKESNLALLINDTRK